MTDTERQRYREKKTEIADELLQLDESGGLSDFSYALEDTDPRLLDYVLSVIRDPDGHNLYELAKIRRFFQMLGRWKWNADRVRRFFKFYELIKFSGVNGRQRYKLTPVQCFQFANIFGFMHDDGRRLIRTACIFVPRKFSKTTSAAALAVYDLLFGDSNAQAYVAANSYNQAKICFDEIRSIMRGLDPREKHFRVNREKITFRDGARDSLAACLAANAKTQDGLYASLVIMDEYAAARDTATKSGADMRNVLQTSMGPRREPLLLVITTASDVVDGPFAHELEGLKNVVLGKMENDTVFADLFMPDVDDENGDPRTWAKVQPHLGVTVQPDFYEHEWQNAQLSAENMLAFCTKLLNRFVVNEKQTWFTTEDAARLLIGDEIVFTEAYQRRGTVPVSAIDTRKAFDLGYWRSNEGHIPRDRVLCCMAFDLSVHDDFSAVSYAMRLPGSGLFFVHTDYYFPEGALKGHANAELYKIWHDMGHLTFCKGDVIDVEQITEDIMTRSRVFNIVRIGYDAYKAQLLVNNLYTLGGQDLLAPFSQTMGNFNKPVETFEMFARATPPRIKFNNNPINTYCLTNCVISEDTMENKKPMKISQTRKIDGTISALMAFGLLMSLEF